MISCSLHGDRKHLLELELSGGVFCKAGLRAETRVVVTLAAEMAEMADKGLGTAQGSRRRTHPAAARNPANDALGSKQANAGYGNVSEHETPSSREEVDEG